MPRSSKSAKATHLGKVTRPVTKKKSAARSRPRTAAPLPVSLPVPEKKSPTPAAPLKQKPFWLVLIFCLIALTGFELVSLLHAKINLQHKLVLIRYFGDRGEMPDKIGKFWGSSRVRIDEAHQRFCMVESMFNKIMYWDLQTGTHLADVDKDGPHQVDAKGNPVVKDFTPLNGDLDAAGNFYVTDKAHAKVYVFSPEFKLLGSWNAVPSDKIAVNAQGQVYLFDNALVEIIQYSAQGQVLKRFGRDEIANPGRMVTDESGTLYVFDQGRSRMLVFSADGKKLSDFSLDVRPSSDLDFEVRGGKIYLSVYQEQRLYVYTAAGSFIGDAVQSFPGTIAVDANGLVYLAGPGSVGVFRFEKQFP